MDDNWKGAYEVVDESSISNNFNIIKYHSMYTIKEESLQPDHSKPRLKPRNVLYSNMYKEHFRVRKDSAPADIAVVRFFISIGLMIGFTLSPADVKGRIHA